MTEFRRALDRSSFGTEGSRKARRTVTQEQRSRVLDKIATKRSSTSKKGEVWPLIVMRPNVAENSDAGHS